MRGRWAVRLSGRLKDMELRAAPAPCPGCGEPVTGSHRQRHEEWKRYFARLIAVPAAWKGMLAFCRRVMELEKGWPRTEQRWAQLHAANPSLLEMIEESRRLILEDAAREEAGRCGRLRAPNT